MPTDDIWADAEVAATLNAIGLNPGVDAHLPPEVRFVRRIHELVAASELRHGPMTSPAIFIYTPPNSAKPHPDAALHRRIHSGETDVSGRVWFVPSSAKTAFSLPAADSSTDRIFEQCEALGLDESPAVFCDVNAIPPAFAWYPSGIREADDVIECPISKAGAPSLDDIVNVVENVYKTKLMTSFNQTADSTLWTNRNLYHAHRLAERRVQEALVAGLGGTFGDPYFVVQERAGQTGRFDIGLRERATDGASILHAILELKVARAYGSGGAVKSLSAVTEAVVDGVEQARAYSDEHNAKTAACLVFDLRKAEQQKLPTEAEARAQQLGVFLRLWRCFPTSKHYRQFKLPA